MRIWPQLLLVAWMVGACHAEPQAPPAPNPAAPHATSAVAHPAAPPATPPGKPAARAQPALPKLVLADEGWGSASKQDVRKVLESAAGALWRHAPPQAAPLIEVKPRGGPIVLFKRGPMGEHRVRLNTSDQYWAQYAFQFSHELCHILSGYDEDDTGQKWFEETLCEVASLFVLRRMAESWRTDPPYPNWRDYAPSLADYAQQRIKAHPLPEGLTLSAWHAAHAAELGRLATNRGLNTVAAAALLPLFEREPECWAAVAYLNVAKPKARQTLREYLADWRRNLPAAGGPEGVGAEEADRRRAFVDRIAKALGAD